MRATAACQFTLSRFHVWRIAVMFLTVSVLLALMFWWLGHRQALHWGVSLAVCFMLVAALGLGASLARPAAVDVRWDGQHWHVGPTDSTGASMASGSLSVALDLGRWMLLRFEASTPLGGSRVSWLPVQRRGLERHWHALRCAVYSPRPAADADAAVDL